MRSTVNQGLLLSSGSVLLGTVFGVAALFAGNAVSLDAPQVRHDAEIWTARALGAYQRTGSRRISFENGIARPVAGIEPLPDRTSTANVALIDRSAR